MKIMKVVKQRLPKIYRKTLLYKSGVEYGDYCLNHVEGCSHGCRYPCYAMMMKKRHGLIKNYQEWIKPKLVGNALELLDKEIPKHKDKIKFVHLCFSTDPFMYKQPEVVDLTLKIIKRLNQDKIKCTTLTKGVYPKKLLDTKTYSSRNEYGITLVSLSEKFKMTYEPYSSPIQKRIQSLKMLHKAELSTWVSIEPYPTPNIVHQNLKELLSSISFVDKIIFGKWNYSSLVSSYKENIKFYEESAEIVESFCKDKKIEYHIKFGTRAKKQPTRLKTEKLFKNDFQKKETLPPERFIYA